MTRRVHFAATNQCAPIPQWYENVQNNDQLRQRWWSKQEKQEMEYNLFDIVECEEQSEEIQLYRQTLLQVHDGAGRFHELKQEILSYWVQVGHRGLEQYLVEELRLSRKQQKSHVSSAVMFVQDVCDQQGLAPDVSAELIRTASESVSCVCTRYAAIIGAADEAAARIEYGQQQATVPVEGRIGRRHEQENDNSNMDRFGLNASTSNACLRERRNVPIPAAE